MKIFRKGEKCREIFRKIPLRISVTGIRGKSSTVRNLYEELEKRGLDVYGKISGNRTLSLYDGKERKVERKKGPSMLENYREVSKYSPEDAVVMENQGINEYKNWILHESILKPNIIAVTNIRQDHFQEYGKSLENVATAMARTTKKGSTLVCGEQKPDIVELMKKIVENRGGTFINSKVPERHRGKLGAETVQLLDTVLRKTGFEGLSEKEKKKKIESMKPEWMKYKDMRIYNAAEVNDIHSTEMVRKNLVKEGEKITPFIYLRPDRRARTVSFINYMEKLVEKNLVGNIHVAGEPTKLFKKNFGETVVEHNSEEDAEKVLEKIVSEGLPIILMGNTKPQMMRDIERTIKK